MSFRVLILSSVQKSIQSWALSDFVLVDVFLRLREHLAANGPSCLRRAKEPFDGMLYEFSLIDPENRLRQHMFWFLVVFAQDEETLVVARGGYARRDGV